MQTKLLSSLLETLIEINRYGKFYTGFRYYTDENSKEMLAVDLYKGSENFYHGTANTNTELLDLIEDIKDVTRSKTMWNIKYSDQYVDVDINVPSEALAAARAFKLKQDYNIDATITEILA